MITMTSYNKGLPVNRATEATATKASIVDEEKRKKAVAAQQALTGKKLDTQASKSKNNAKTNVSVRPTTPKHAISCQQAKNGSPDAPGSLRILNRTESCNAVCKTLKPKRITASKPSNTDTPDSRRCLNSAVSCGARWISNESQPNLNQRQGRQDEYNPEKYQNFTGDDYDVDDNDKTVVDDSLELTHKRYQNDSHYNDDIDYGSSYDKKTVVGDSPESNQNVSIPQRSSSLDLHKDTPAQKTHASLSTDCSNALPKTETRRVNPGINSKSDLPASDKSVEELSEVCNARLNVGNNDKITNNLGHESQGAKPKQRSARNESSYDLDGDDDRPYEKPGGRQGYSYSREDLTDNMNLQFYKNEIKYKPWGCKIEKLLDCKGDYRKLETDHSYIQWLFPTGEASRVNSYSQPIKGEEAEAIRENPELKYRFLRAYTMMLDFYGMRLKSEETGQVQRSRNWESRLAHLNRSNHNHYRITRIITALGIFGYEHFQKPWLLFFLEEILVKHTLSFIPEKVLFHWIEALNSTDDKAFIYEEYSRLYSGRS